MGILLKIFYRSYKLTKNPHYILLKNSATNFFLYLSFTKSSNELAMVHQIGIVHQNLQPDSHSFLNQPGIFNYFQHSIFTDINFDLFLLIDKVIIKLFNAP